MSSRVIGLGLLVLVGCAPDRPAAPAGGSALPDAEARLVGREVAGEVTDLTASFTVGGFFLPGFPSAGIAPSAADGPQPTTTCPTITPFPPVDADGDHVPDDATLSFTLPDCRFARDGRTLEITGTVHITDPSATAFGLRAGFTDFQHRVTDAGGRFFLSRLNGVRQALRSAAGFSLIDSTAADRESSEHGAARLVKAWAVSFAVAAGQTVDQLHGLPSGDLTVNGSMSWTHDTVTQSFAVSTVTPLHHDAACTTPPRFTAGELLLTRTGPRGTVTIHVVFTGCGQEPTVTVEHTAA